MISTVFVISLQSFWDIEVVACMPLCRLVPKAVTATFSTCGVHVQLTELNLERNKMTKEKVNLENQLEAEQEYILNKLHKQVCKLRMPAPILADLHFAGVYMPKGCNISKQVRGGHRVSFLTSNLQELFTPNTSPRKSIWDLFWLLHIGAVV